MSDLYYLPQTGDDLDEVELAEARMPGFTWHVVDNRIRGMCDEKEALEQTIYHILSIERYKYVIYPQSYGSEIADLIGKPHDYAAAELKRTITEALTQDDRVVSVGEWDIVFGEDKDALTVGCTVETIYGEIEIKGELTR